MATLAIRMTESLTFPSSLAFMATFISSTRRSFRVNSRHSLLELAFTCSFRLFPFLHAWFLICLVFTSLCTNPCLLTSTLEPAECGIQGFVFTNFDFTHCLIPPSTGSSQIYFFIILDEVV